MFAFGNPSVLTALKACGISVFCEKTMHTKVCIYHTANAEICQARGALRSA